MTLEVKNIGSKLMSWNTPMPADLCSRSDWSFTSVLSRSMPSKRHLMLFLYSLFTMQSTMAQSLTIFRTLWLERVTFLSRKHTKRWKRSLPLSVSKLSLKLRTKLGFWRTTVILRRSSSITFAITNLQMISRLMMMIKIRGQTCSKMRSIHLLL